MRRLKYSKDTLDAFFDAIDRGESSLRAAAGLDINKHSAATFKRDYLNALALFPDDPRDANGRPRKEKQASKKQATQAKKQATHPQPETPVPSRPQPVQAVPRITIGFDADTLSTSRSDEQVLQLLADIKKAVNALTKTLREDIASRKDVAAVKDAMETVTATLREDIQSRKEQARKGVSTSAPAKVAASNGTGSKTFGSLNETPLPASTITPPDGGESLADLLETHLEDVLQCVAYSMTTAEIAEALDIESDIVCRIRGSREFAEALDAPPDPISTSRFD